MKFKQSISDKGLQRLAKTLKQSQVVSQEDKAGLIENMMVALQAPSAEYMATSEAGTGVGSVVTQWEALDVVRAALYDLPDEFVGRGL